MKLLFFTINNSFYGHKMDFIFFLNGNIFLLTISCGGFNDDFSTMNIIIIIRQRICSAIFFSVLKIGNLKILSNKSIDFLE